MDRRRFLQSIGVASAAALGTDSGAEEGETGRDTQSLPPARRTAKPIERKAWLFWDLWHLDRAENLVLRQGRAQWRPEATYVDDVDGLAAWPSVYRHESSRRWRMLYTSRWKPYTLFVLESDDGIRFRPLPCDDILPEEQKHAANHIFTLRDGSCGGVYFDPVAADGFPLKVFGHQQGKAVHQRALDDPKHRWHSAAKAGRAKPYMAEELTLVSRDGLHWETRFDMGWGLLDWHPEPPIFGFYNRRLGRHMMTVRPGWGDRRVCIQSTTDFRRWSGPELLFQPDPMDEPLLEHYGMPVFLYEGTYVGLLWVFHNSSSAPTESFNRFVGPLDCQLAYSYDGVRFMRGRREPLIGLSEPGEHGCGGIEPSSLVVADDEIRIYSSGSKSQHGRNFQERRAGAKNFEAILLHTLRKDGFTYLESLGSWARFVSKPLVLLGDNLTINVAAPWGEVRYQLCDLKSEPIAGFAYDDCEAAVREDSLDRPLRWGDKNLSELVGQVVRLDFTFRAARLYALRGAFHFIDAQDLHMLRDGLTIDTSLFDF